MKTYRQSQLKDAKSLIGCGTVLLATCVVCALDRPDWLHVTCEVASGLFGTLFLGAGIRLKYIVYQDYKREQRMKT